jgi:hypothetical protein
MSIFKSNKTSLISRSSKYQIDIAIVLVGVIPILITVFLTFFDAGGLSDKIQIVIVAITIILALSGIVILHKYPKNILKLRQYLESMAEGKIPEHIDFDRCEDDIIEIEKFLHAIIAEMKIKVEQLEAKLTIEKVLNENISKKTEDVVKEVQSKVMFESIGAVCHHIGQPATVLNTYLYSLLKEEDLPPRIKAQLEECSRATNKIADILLQIQTIDGYKTVIYRNKDLSETGNIDDKILDIN